MVDAANELKNLDVSFKAWFKKSNNISKSDIDALYKKILSDYQKKELDKKELDKVKKELDKVKKEKCKALENENKTILQFKKFRRTCKICKECLGFFAQNCGAQNDFSNNLDYKKLNEKLDKYLNLVDRKNSNYDNLKEITGNDAFKQFQTERKKLMEQTMNFFRKNKKFITDDEDKYLKSLKNWYSTVYNSLRKNIDKVRESKSKSKEQKEAEGLSEWMKNTFTSNNENSGVKLRDIAMLSAHDAGSYTMKPEYYAVSKLGKAAQTQTLNFMGQLRSGVRQFDFRMKLSNSVPVFFHGVVNGAPVTEAIQQITKFIASNRKEVVILQIKADKACFDKFYKLPCVKQLSKYIYYDVNQPSKCIDIKEDEVGNITYEDIIGADKNVLILNPNQTVSKFNEKIRTTHNAENIANTELTELENKDKSKKLHKITPIDTAKLKDFLSKNNKWVPLKNAKKNSATIYKKLINDPNFKKLANLIGIDAAGSKESLELAKNVVEINQERLKSPKTANSK